MGQRALPLLWYLGHGAPCLVRRRVTMPILARVQIIYIYKMLGVCGYLRNGVSGGREEERFSRRKEQ